MYVNMDILEETGMSDKSGLSPIRRIEAIWGYPPFLSNRDDNGPLRGSREDHESRRGFPET